MTSTTPFYASVKYVYGSFTVYHCYMKDQSYFYSAHSPEIYDPTSEYYTYGGHASYYKGRLKTIDALNPKIINYVYTGHYEWNDFSSYLPELDSANEWQLTCADGDLEWWCFNSPNKLKIDYLPITEQIVINENIGLLILEGTLNVIDKDNSFTATNMNYIKPREYPIIVNGDAKVWTIKHIL